MHEGTAVGPVERAAVLGRAGILRLFLRQVFEFGLLAEVGNDLFRFGFGFHQNVARTVFRLDGFGLGLVVRGLDFGVGHRMGFDVVLQIGLGQLILAANIQGGSQPRLLVESLVHGGARQQFQVDQRLAHTGVELRRIRLALGHFTLDQFAIQGGDFLAVDHGQRLAGSAAGVAAAGLGWPQQGQGFVPAPAETGPAGSGRGEVQRAFGFLSEFFRG